MEPIYEKNDFNWLLGEANQCMVRETGDEVESPLSISLYPPWSHPFSEVSPYFKPLSLCQCQLLSDIFSRGGYFNQREVRTVPAANNAISYLFFLYDEYRILAAGMETHVISSGHKTQVLVCLSLWSLWCVQAQLFGQNTGDVRQSQQSRCLFSDVGSVSLGQLRSSGGLNKTPNWC